MTKYIIRIDDVYEYMNLRKYNIVMNILDRNNIKALLAVTPEWKLKKRKKKEFIIGNMKREEFFKMVREEKEKGHIIGMHGYTHEFHTTNSGLIGLNRYSEFAGLKEEYQEEYIRKGKKILEKEKLKTNIFIAPAHSYDETTIRILKREGFEIISDGLYFYPETRKGITYIPQQFGKPRKSPIGTITIAIHPNEITEKQIEELKEFIKENKEKITNIKKEVEETKNNIFKQILNRITETIIGIVLKITR